MTAGASGMSDEYIEQQRFSIDTFMGDWGEAYSRVDISHTAHLARERHGIRLREDSHSFRAKRSLHAALLGASLAAPETGEVRVARPRPDGRREGARGHPGGAVTAAAHLAACSRVNNSRSSGADLIEPFPNSA